MGVSIEHFDLGVSSALNRSLLKSHPLLPLISYKTADRKSIGSALNFEFSIALGPKRHFPSQNSKFFLSPFSSHLLYHPVYTHQQFFVRVHQDTGGVHPLFKKSHVFRQAPLLFVFVSWHWHCSCWNLIHLESSSGCLRWLLSDCCYFWHWLEQFYPIEGLTELSFSLLGCFQLY